MGRRFFVRACPDKPIEAPCYETCCRSCSEGRANDPVFGENLEGKYIHERQRTQTSATKSRAIIYFILFQS